MGRELVYAGTRRRNVLPPTETAIKLLCAFVIRHGQYDYLKLHVDCCDAGLPSITTDFLDYGCHVISFVQWTALHSSRADKSIRRRYRSILLCKKSNISLRISGTSALKRLFDAEVAEIRREPQRKNQCGMSP